MNKHISQADKSAKAGKKKAAEALEKKHADDLLNEALEETFPASDAPEVTRHSPSDSTK